MIIRHLILEEPGLYLGKHSERLQVTRVKTNEIVAQAPLMHLESVLITSRGVSLSADAVHECAERGIPIHFLSAVDSSIASLYSAGLTGTILTRRQQLLAYSDSRGTYLAFAFIKAKIQNQVAFLKYAARYRKETDPERYALIIPLIDQVSEHVHELNRLQEQNPECCVDDIRFSLLSVEGRAAQAYWQAIGTLLIPELEWPGRRTRGANDVFNSALNYGYGILYHAIERACLLAGLDPFAGFLHVDRPGKPSLVLDIIEEFRQSVVDRTVLAYFNKGQSLNLEEDGKIASESRRSLAEKILDRLDAREQIGTEHFTVRSIIQRQARQLAAFLRGERDDYSSYLYS
ncbi:MAG: CRISPR-associated endonuclease Cas1 [Anaerolinea sp.]|nr:CRISPR-associated endonuclease Cas1 [Anaerolinea sp.]